MSSFVIVKKNNLKVRQKDYSKHPNTWVVLEWWLDCDAVENWSALEMHPNRLEWWLDW